MKSISARMLAAALLAALAGGVMLLGQSANELFEKALVKERSEGDLHQAIKLYQAVVEKHGKDRPLAAKALLQMGECYERLGEADARKAYDRLLRDYADQSETAAEARLRLAALENHAGGAHAPRVRQIWSGSEVDPEGWVSPDGRYLTFPEWKTGDLDVRDLLTGTDRRLTDKGSWEKSADFAEDSCFSRDGKKIAYNWWAKGRPGYELRVMNADGSGVRTLWSPGGFYVYPYDWSPDGKQIVATLWKDDGSAEGYLVSTADGTARRLPGLSTRYPGRISFSPDGRYLVFSDRPPGATQADLFVMSMATGKKTPLVEHPAQDWAPLWTFDGKRVLFLSDRTGGVGLWSIAVANGKPQGTPELIKAGLGKRVAPLGITTAGSYYYAIRAGMDDIYVADLDPATGKVIGSPVKVAARYVGSNEGPSWSPDGRILAYRSNREVAPGPMGATIVLRSWDDGREKELVTPAVLRQGWSTPVAWYPDGSAFLVRSRSESRGAVYYRIDARTGQALLVHEDDRPFGAWDFPCISADGKKLYRVVNQRSEARAAIVAQNLETGQELVIYQSRLRIRSTALSRDGRYLAFIEPPPPGPPDSDRRLMVLALSGGEPRLLLKSPLPIGSTGLAWSPDGRYIFFESGTYPINKLWRVSTDTGVAAETGVTMPRLRFASVRPDGKKIAFTAGQGGFDEVWVLEIFLPVLRASR